jgi:transcriptional regulator with XRE-family HTH domain
MRSIGERLEEARKRKGISLREAAEATKIRADFLSAIEQNTFDFDLPDIYKRGFLKNYARYLKLDVEKILADYSAQQLSQSRLGKKAGSEWFGTMETKREEADEADAPARPKSATASESATSGSGAHFGMIRSKPTREDDPAAEGAEEADSEKTFYLKIAVIVAGALALFFVLFGLIWAIIGSGDPETPAPDPAPLRSGTGSSATDQLTGGATNTNSATSDALTLRASGNVYVLIRQKSDGAELLRRTMSAGETVTIEKSGPVDVLFTAGEFLTIEHRGESLRPSSAGTAKISIP